MENHLGMVGLYMFATVYLMIMHKKYHISYVYYGTISWEYSPITLQLNLTGAFHAGNGGMIQKNAINSHPHSPKSLRLAPGSYTMWGLVVVSCCSPWTDISTINHAPGKSTNLANLAPTLQKAYRFFLILTPYNSQQKAEESPQQGPNLFRIPVSCGLLWPDLRPLTAPELEAAVVALQRQGSGLLGADDGL